ncbi:Rieske 2Fe-2S domain-containing protein [Planctomycetaceae bacterium]|jgi:cytochrome b6-f complex iron-sulfur subunit|nr:Rieske 2Fe-2S domain-containing protein [Planctomycetaceae bacterium]MDC0261664.1 Rieske 2Fe-2S domain-containing protein [Planctomycetaceae bacterium]MDC0308282.1 Rieske 2Fe-2S domain-containing protein [Planctomycetaceae bacterium]
MICPFVVASYFFKEYEYLDSRMADDKKKLSTADILAQARAQSNSGDGSAETPSSPEAPVSPETPDTPVAPSVAAPQSTSDILAAARAQTGGGDAKSEKPSGAAPKGTSDILAAARAQSTAGSAPAGGGAAPKSTSDILAAARAQSGQGGSGEATAPAAKKTTAKATVPVGDLPPVKDMVEAMKSGKTTEEVKSGPVKPKIPTRPPKSPKPAPKAKVETRRNFSVALLVSPFALAWLLLTLTSGGFVLYVARFMMPNVLVEPPSKFKIGPATDYGFGTVATKWKSQFGVWIVNTDYNGRKMIYALASVCTHLGCTPNWLGGEQKFKCPCHGSGFYITGINFEGPAPRPLERVGIALGSDGMLEVDKSVKFQEELGQWNDSASFVEV